MRTFALMVLAFVAGFVVIRRVSGFFLTPAGMRSVPSNARAKDPLPRASPERPVPTELPVAPTAEVPVEPPAVAVDPQTELGTTIADLLSQFQAGNYYAAVRTYMQPSVAKSMSVEKLAALEKSFETASQPGTIEYERMQHMIRALQAIEHAEPEMNNVADIATFRIPIAAPPVLEGKVPTTIKFYLEDGRWYLR